MTLQDLGSVGEFVAAVATVVTLVYLAIQIRQNTRFVRASSFQACTRDAFDIIDQIALDPELNRIYFAGTRDYRSLSAEDRKRFGAFMSSLLGRWENFEFQCSQSVLDRESFSFFHANMRVAFSQRGTWQWWDKARHLFSPAVQQLIEDQFERPAPEAP